ncbi:MAG: MBL fold metallo-hydrolase [Clostridia bacterium]
MANSSTKKSRLIAKTVIILVVTILFVTSLFFANQIEHLLGINSLTENKVSSKIINSEPFSLHYIDVGQADCSLIVLPDGKKMLIDAGDRTIESKNKVKEYLKNKNITIIDYLVLTHSDSDHAGGMKMVLDEFEVKNIFRPFQIASNSDGSLYNGDPLSLYVENLPADAPNIEYNKVTTQTYRDFIDSAYNETYTDGESNKSAVVMTNYDGYEIVSSNYSISWFAPSLIEGYKNPIGYKGSNSEGYMTKYYKDANDYSPIISINYKNDNFVFTGDAESMAEKDFVASFSKRQDNDKNKIINCAVYKAGHHGSKTSSTTDFIQILNPKIVVISVGAGNSYNHPSPELINRLYQTKCWTEKYNRIYRTDKNGTIIISKNDSDIMIALENDKHSVFNAVKWWQIGLGIYAVIVISVVFIKGNVTIKKTAKIIKQAGSK